MEILNISGKGVDHVIHRLLLFTIATVASLQQDQMVQNTQSGL